MAAQEKSLLELMNDMGKALTEYDGVQRKPITLKKVSAPDSFTHEDEVITVISEYRVLNYGWWFDGERPHVQIVSLLLDGGGREQVKVPTTFFSGGALLAMEEQIADELEAEGPQDAGAGEEQ